MEPDHEISRKMSHNQWVNDVEKDLAEGRLDGFEHGSHEGMAPFLFRVPAKVREMNEKAYQPELVSIGPYHHGEEGLQAMEMNKRRALLHFLCRSKQTPTKCLDLLRGSLPEIREAYVDNLDRKWKDDDEFLKLLLMDGCFILEVLFTSVGAVEEYQKGDPIFGRHGRFYNAPSIRRDLLLIENQIPLLVLRRLNYLSDSALIGFLLEFLLECGVGIGDSHTIFGGDDLGQSLHILDLYRRAFAFGDDDDGASFGREERVDYKKKLSAPKIPSAMALQDHGIVLRKRSLPVIRFSRRRMLRRLLSANIRGRALDLPRLTVDDTTESVFLNAMAFESLQRHAVDAKFTSYVSLMSQLMVSPKDANLLSTELGIIRNELIGSDQALVDLFRNLSLANFLPDYRLFLLQIVINEYCGRRWNRFQANLNRSYLRNPWVIPVVYAIIILVLTAIQAFYSIFPNKDNPK